MTTTNVASQGKSAQGTLWRDATRNAVSPGAATTRRPRQAPDHQSAQRWSGFANATLALVILLAGFGIWRVYDGMNASVPADPEGTIPGLAMQPATPEPTELPAVAAPPVATPAPASACDFSADIPIFPGVDQSPIDGTALLLTTNGELHLTCPEEPDPIRLATGIDQTSPMNWPGIVSLMGEGDPGSQPISVINVLNGRSITLSTPPEAMASRWTQPSGTPWLISPVTGAPDDWAITDLRTMESRPYSELSGVNLPKGTILNPAIGDGNGTLVVVPWFHASPEDTGSPVQGKGTPGTALVVTGSLDNVHTITLPADLPPIVDMRLAPDGQHLALTARESGGQPIGDTIYSIIRTVDGHEVGRSEAAPVYDSTLALAWVQDGKALAYLQESSLLLLPVNGDGTSVTLLDINDSLAFLRTAYDPDVVTVTAIQPEEVATETPDAVRAVMYSVNTVTGKVIELEGWDVRTSYSWELPRSRYLVLSDTWVDTTDPVTYRVVDAVTGEEVGTLSDVTLAELQGHVALGRHALALSDDGSTMVIGFGSKHIYLVHLVDEAPVVRQVASPFGLDPEFNGQVEIFLSADGSMLSLTLEGDESRTRWLLPLDGEPDEWIEVPSTAPGEGPAYIFFVPGTGE